MNCKETTSSALDEELKKDKKEILKYAIPSMIEQMCITVTSVIDSQMVSALGVTYISAVSVTNQPRMFVTTPFFAINTVISSLIAYYYGKKDRDKANSIFATALWIVIVLSVSLGVLCFVFAVPIMKLCSGQEDTLDLSVQYFRIVMLCLVFNVLFMAINAGLRGYGKTNLSLWTNIISCVVDIIFNYLLIEGHFGFPALGISGAAIATVLGTVAALILALVFVLRDKEFLNVKYCIKKKIHFSKESFKEIAKDWKEVFVERIMMRIGSLICSAITARIGSYQMSIYSIAYNLLDVNYSIGIGFQNASIVIIGRNRGEGKNNSIVDKSHKLLRMSAICGVIMSVVFIALAYPYVLMYSDDSTFVKYAFIACVIFSFISIVQVPKITTTGILQGLGMMRETKKASIYAIVIAQNVINFLCVIVFNIGLLGVMLAIVLSQILWFIISFYYYKKGIVKYR